MPILMLSTRHPTYVARAVALGARGFLLKEVTRDKLVEGHQAAATGQSAWTRESCAVTGCPGTPRLAADVEVPL